MDIYAEEVMDYYENPRNQGELSGDDVITARDSNASCGDLLQFFVKAQAGKIVDVKWTGIGCAISTASASKLSEWLMNKKIEDIRKLGEEELVKKAIGFEVNPGRAKCLTLPARVVAKLWES